MAEFDLKETAKAVNGRLVGGRAKKAKGVSIDSRTIAKRNIYIAIKGENFDGHNFVADAFSKGAVVAIISRPELLKDFPNKSFIVVDDTLAALQNLAGWRRRQMKKLLVIGITGSNGKTTVKEMTAAILSYKYKTLKTEGNLNNHIGVPLTLLKLTSKHEAAVIEMGMNAKGEIALLTKMAKPSIGVITNISQAHIGNFASLAKIRTAKAELIENMPKTGKAVLNADDPNSEPLIEQARLKTRTFGKNQLADVSLVDSWKNGGAGQWASVYFKGKEINAHVPLIGAHQIENALAAIAVGTLAGVDLKDMARGLNRVKPASMRMEPENLPNGALVLNDAYNANPASTEKALMAASELKKDGRLFFVFGDMKELGKKSEAAHKRIGKIAAKVGVNGIYTLGTSATFTAKEAKLKGVRSTRAKSHEQIAVALFKTIRANDVVLVKGSRSMAMEKVVNRLIELAKG
ncbi:UDP-N-acetylmuramoyl-tripeptide--D-alanyl-D-alanine ligase [hydrothermal vent metagenome]|uniref:UDP-MurNAc-pentapeptide synthetase n=1 Tax=hydrothermal vent metagenome TaxID=652676 RepID=A0A3B1CEZ7_9ZZZZ